jgi:hypothetical protein
MRSANGNGRGAIDSGRSQEHHRNDRAVPLLEIERIDRRVSPIDMPLAYADRSFPSCAVKPRECDKECTLRSHVRPFPSIGSDERVYRRQQLGRQEPVKWLSGSATEHVAGHAWRVRVYLLFALKRFQNVTGALHSQLGIEGIPDD